MEESDGLSICDWYYVGSERLFDDCFTPTQTDVCHVSDRVMIFAAIAGNNRTKVVDLLEDGFPVNETLAPLGTKMTVTALHAAIMYGREEIVETLLSFGADVNKKRDDGFTPAKLIYHFGDVGLLHRLLRYGGWVSNCDLLPAEDDFFDPDPESDAEEDSRQSKQLNQYFQALRDSDEVYLQKHIDNSILTLNDCFGRSAVTYAAMLGREKYVRWMISKGKNIGKLHLGAPSERAVGALHWAIVRGHTKTAQLILEQGARACGLANSAYAARLLHAAAMSDNVTVLQHLHRAVASESIDLSYQQLWPVLREAIAFSSDDICKELLNICLRKISLTTLKTTPPGSRTSILIHTIKFSRAEIVEVLLKMGMPPAGETLADGSTPLREALSVVNPTIVRLLLSHGASVPKDDEKVSSFIKLATTPSLRPSSAIRKCAKLLLSCRAKPK